MLYLAPPSLVRVSLSEISPSIQIHIRVTIINSGAAAGCIRRDFATLYPKGSSKIIVNCANLAIRKPATSSDIILDDAVTYDQIARVENTCTTTGPAILNS